MSLSTLLGDVDPGWYVPDRESAGAAPLDAALLRKAGGSPLGQRLLAQWLLEGADAAHLLAPQADGAMAPVTRRWTRERLGAAMRDLGILAFAPAIRSEVRREPVRMLKRILGNSYMLALDKAIWDGKIDAAVSKRLDAQLREALSDAASAESALHALFDAQGSNELRTWARERDPALGEWIALQDPPRTLGPAHLPEKQVLFLHSHHDARPIAH